MWISQADCNQAHPTTKLLYLVQITFTSNLLSSELFLEHLFFNHWLDMLPSPVLTHTSCSPQMHLHTSCFLIWATLVSFGVSVLLFWHLWAGPKELLRKPWISTQDWFICSKKGHSKAMSGPGRTLSITCPCALLHPMQLLQTPIGLLQSAPEIKAEWKVFLLYFNGNSSKTKHTKFFIPVPSVKPVQAGEGHEMLFSQKESLCQAQIRGVLRLSGLGGWTS